MIQENKTEQEIIKPEIAQFSRGSDILLLKLIQRINSEHRMKPWYINEFMDLGYSYNQIRKCMQQLEKRGLIKKVRAYPVFWERIT